jgi:hypothetical protein
LLTSFHLMDHHDSHNTANLPHGGPYGFYPTEQEANFDMVYPQQGINTYPGVVPAAPPPRGYQSSLCRSSSCSPNHLLTPPFQNSNRLFRCGP